MSVEAEIRRIQSRLGAIRVTVEWDRRKFQVAAVIVTGPTVRDGVTTVQLGSGATIEEAVGSSQTRLDGWLREEERNFLRERIFRGA